MNRSNINKYLALTIFLISTSLAGFGQRSKLTLADKHFKTFTYSEAVPIYEDVLEKYPNNLEALRKISLSLSNLDRNTEAEPYLKQLSEHEGNEPQDLVLFADILKRNDKFEKASLVYELLAQKDPENTIAQRYLDDPNWIERLFMDSSRYEIKSAGINSDKSDFAPSFFQDKILFSSARKEGKGRYHSYNWNDQSYLNLYTSTISKDSTLSNPTVLKSKINSRFHEGTVTYDPKNDLLYITRNNFVKGKQKKDDSGNLNLGIYTLEYNNGEFGKIEPFDFNNESYSVGHPTLSADGKKLYFISDMPGGEGGTDIYYCELVNGGWVQPQNMGDEVNTPGNEMFPFALGNEAIYFASDGHVGLGGLDMYNYNLEAENSKVTNMGYPANTIHDDFGIAVFPDGNSGYFSSNRPGGKGDDDIYKFSVHSPPEVWISGTIRDENTLEPIPHATIFLFDSNNGPLTRVAETDSAGQYKFGADLQEVYILVGTKRGYTEKTFEVVSGLDMRFIENADMNLSKYDNMIEGQILYSNNEPAEDVNLTLSDSTGSVKDQSVTGPDGRYFFAFNLDQQYILTCEKEGFVSQQIELDSMSVTSEKIKSDFRLYHPEKGEVVQMGDIYYDYNKAELRREAKLELNKLAQVLNDNPKMKIAINSHTDCRGSSDYNIELSRKRAQTAVDFLVKHGIDQKRLRSKGYGESKPVNDCCDENCPEEEHQENRRTEFLIWDI